MESGQTVEESLIALIAKMGEKITIGRVKTFNHTGSKNFNYLQISSECRITKSNHLCQWWTRYGLCHTRCFQSTWIERA